MRQTQESQIQAVLSLAFRVAKRKGLSIDDSADIAQEVAVAYLAGETRPADNWEAWVTTVTKNRVIDHQRRVAIVGRASDQDQHTDFDAYRQGQFEMGSSLRASSRVMLDELLSGLSERDRKILTLDAIGLSKSEIAEQVGLANANSARVTLSRIKKRLRDQHPELVGDIAHPRQY